MTYKVYEDISQIVRKDVGDKFMDDVRLWPIVCDQTGSMVLSNTTNFIWGSGLQTDILRSSVWDCIDDWIKENEL